MRLNRVLPLFALAFCAAAATAFAEQTPTARGPWTDRLDREVREAFSGEETELLLAATALARSRGVEGAVDFTTRHTGQAQIGHVLTLLVADDDLARELEDPVGFIRIIPDEDQREQAAAVLGVALVRAGRVDRAGDVLELVKDPRLIDRTRARMAEAHARAGRVTEAEQVARRIDDQQRRQRALESVRHIVQAKDVAMWVGTKSFPGQQLVALSQFVPRNEIPWQAIEIHRAPTGGAAEREEIVAELLPQLRRLDEPVRLLGVTSLLVWSIQFPEETLTAELVRKMLDDAAAQPPEHLRLSDMILPLMGYVAAHRGLVGELEEVVAIGQARGGNQSVLLYSIGMGFAAADRQQDAERFYDQLSPATRLPFVAGVVAAQ